MDSLAEEIDLPRRSDRVSKPPVRFVFEEPKKRSRKRKREDEDEVMSNFILPAKRRIAEGLTNEQVAKQVGKQFEEIFLESLQRAHLSPQRLQTRSAALRKTFRNATELMHNGNVTTTKNGEYLVTSSDGTKTYQVRSVPLADRLHFICDCGRQFGQGDRVTCKHIFAVIFMALNSVSTMFLQVSSHRTVQDMHELCKLAEQLDIGVQKPSRASSSSSSGHPVKQLGNAVHRRPSFKKTR
jgi:hypothetical protein